MKLSEFVALIKAFCPIRHLSAAGMPVLLVVLFYSIDFSSNDMQIGVVLPLTGEHAKRAANHLNGLTLAARQSTIWAA